VKHLGRHFCETSVFSVCILEESWELPFLQCERQVLCVYLNSLSVRQQFIVCHNTFQRSCPSTWLVCTSIWSHLSSISKTCSIHVQWIPAHVGIPGNTLAELEAKRDSTRPQTSVSVDLATARFWFGGRVRRSSMPATYATRTQPHIALWLERPTCSLTGDLAGPEASASLLPSWHNNSCVSHCGGDDETTQHLLLCCLSHTQARTSTNYINSVDPRRMWSFTESIVAVTRSPTRNERESTMCKHWYVGCRKVYIVLIICHLLQFLSVSNCKSHFNSLFMLLRNSFQL